MLTIIRLIGMHIKTLNYLAINHNHIHKYNDDNDFTSPYSFYKSVFLILINLELWSFIALISSMPFYYIKPILSGLEEHTSASKEKCAYIRILEQV